MKETLKEIIALLETKTRSATHCIKCKHMFDECVYNDLPCKYFTAKEVIEELLDDAVD